MSKSSKHFLLSKAMSRREGFQDPETPSQNPETRYPVGTSISYDDMRRLIVTGQLRPIPQEDIVGNHGQTTPDSPTTPDVIDLTPPDHTANVSMEEKIDKTSGNLPTELKGQDQAQNVKEDKEPSFQTSQIPSSAPKSPTSQPTTPTRSTPRSI